MSSPWRAEARVRDEGGNDEKSRMVRTRDGKTIMKLFRLRDGNYANQKRALVLEKENMKTPRWFDRTRFRSHLRVATAASLVATGVVSAILTLPLSSTGSSAPAAQRQMISYDQMQMLTATIGGAQVLPTTQTVTHWFGSTVNPNNGVTYGYNMVGADPNNCSGIECDVTVTADIIPLNVIVDRESFNGSDVVDATLASPVFALNDYGSTPFATVPGAFPDEPFFIRGPGGVLSQNDAGNQLQLQDATMRAQFNKTGLSSYHLRLNPVVHEAITIVVPGGTGLVLETPAGVPFAEIKSQWWATRIQNLNASLGYVDPTHLPIYLTKDVFLYRDNNPFNCCEAGFHAASPALHGNGNQSVQTWAWASYISPGEQSRPDGGTLWALQDISILSHEIAEWADDPFINNFVEPWLTATSAPIYGCVNLLETGDPVVGIGFALGTNIYFQEPTPFGFQCADGYYHPEDQVFLPWFMRLAPNNISEPTQSPSTNVGRYSLMGDLNLFESFHEPATGCN